MSGEETLVKQGPLSLRVERSDGLVVISVYGEADLGSVGILTEELRRAEESDAEQVVLNLRGLDFVDSSGLKTILVAARASARDSNRLGFLRGSGQVARVLELTGIDRAINWLD